MSPYLKSLVIQDFTPLADGVYSWELTDQPLAAVWITIKGTLYAIDQCIDDMLASITSLDVWMGSFNVQHFTHLEKCLMANCKLKQAWPYMVNSSQNVDDYVGVTFPIMFGAPYLNSSMCLPASLNNRKRLDLGLDIANTHMDLIQLDISQMIMPGASPAGAVKMEEITVANALVGEQDVWLQHNWDLLKLLLYSPTVPVTTALTATIHRATLEINDFPWGYNAVPWEHLHAELMDELEGPGNMEDHTHLSTGATAQTGMAEDIDHWSKHFGEMDFFFEKDLKWRAPTAGASSVKLKVVTGVAENYSIVPIEYVPASKL
ncbi:MAG: hypothetical protein MUP64_16150 [Anaerolineae bacterium]|nr:hypothetical protein [Anaerolineae bacterium]